jgi:hypothetical protein
MAILADKHPELIHRLFVLLKNPVHLYGVRLFVCGEWKTVSIDLQFPIKEKGYYCRFRLNQSIWPILLEKSFAKIIGSYLHIRDYTI